MPSLNSRTPCPKPFITSGILRPPKRTRTTIAIINKCMGLSHIGYLPFAPKLGEPGSPDVTVYRVQYSTSMAGRMFTVSSLSARANGGDFPRNREGRFAGLSSLCDGPADNEVICPGFDCFRRRGHASLIIQRGH